MAYYSFFLSKMKGGQSAPENVNEQTSFPVLPVTVSLVYPSLGNFFLIEKKKKKKTNIWEIEVLSRPFCLHKYTTD